LLRKIIRKLFSGQNEFEPSRGYDLWSASYDDQPDNLILYLDDRLFSRLRKMVKLDSTVIADIGCGTGRHWSDILEANPRQLIGFDVSRGMLTALNRKFPGAETHLLRDQSLNPLEAGSCDLLISTLAIAHMPNLESVFTEWARVLKPDGQILITDFHPQALKMGSRRSFNHEGRKLAVKSFIYPVDMVLAKAQTVNLGCEYLEEQKVDESMKSYYERKNAMHAYDRFFGIPIIYGLILKKIHALPKP
jgi:ubiquinone/menaquinone biosynthesis C-methylase UbiE